MVILIHTLPDMYSRQFCKNYDQQLASYWGTVEQPKYSTCDWFNDYLRKRLIVVPRSSQPVFVIHGSSWTKTLAFRVSFPMSTLQATNVKNGQGKSLHSALRTLCAKNARYAPDSLAGLWGYSKLLVKLVFLLTHTRYTFDHHNSTLPSVCLCYNYVHVQRV